MAEGGRRTPNVEGGARAPPYQSKKDTLKPGHQAPNPRQGTIYVASFEAAHLNWLS